MKIVIDARLIKQSGIGRYLERLVTNLLEIDQHNQYVLLVRPEDESQLQHLIKPNCSFVHAPYRWFSLGEQTKLPALISSLKPDLVHFPNFNAPLLYRGPFVATIHDLTLLRFKNIRGGAAHHLIYDAKLPALRLSLRHAVKNSRKVIVPTEFVARDVIQTYRVPASHVAMTYEASDPFVAESGSLPPAVKPPFLLYVGNSYPNKNLRRLVEAFEQLRQKNPGLQLVIAGKPDYWQGGLKRQAPDGVIFTGFVDDAELAGLYQKAEAFVFPSLSEGFGLPPLEAMQAGLPVISSHATCLPEVLGEAAIYFDPTDPADMAAKIEQVLTNKKLRQELVKKGQTQVKKYSWRHMAEQTLAIYEQALAAKH